MKVLIAVSCLLAVASAGYLSPVSHYYAGAQHIPVIGPNGVPLDEPAVAAAKASHAAAHVEASARNGDVAVVAPAIYSGHVAPLAYSTYAAPYGHYAGPQHIPVIGPNGVPLEEPAVVAAKASHAAAHVEAKARNGDLAYVAPVAYAGHYAAPVVAANGVPLDTPEVAAAKVAHAAAHVEAKVRNGDLHYVHPLVHYRKRRGILHGYGAPVVSAYAAPGAYYAGPQHLPVIGANGVPLDEPAVAAAKASHAAAHVEAQARNGDVAYVAPAVYGAAYAAPVSHYAGPQHLPVIGANGVPLDEPAVAAAKASHAAAHVEAKARNGDLAVVAPAVYGAHVAAPYAYAAPVAHYAGPQHIPVIGPNGVPLEEPAVVAAKASHAAAHVEAKVRNGDLSYVAPVIHY